MNRSAAVGRRIAGAIEGLDLPGTASIYCEHRSHSISACIYICGAVGASSHRVVIRPRPAVKGPDQWLCATARVQVRELKLRAIVIGIFN